MLGLLPVRISYGVMFKPLRRKSRFNEWQAVEIALAQKLYGDLNSANMDLAISIRVRFFLSATPFC
jgi:hypothetical protein